MEGSDTTISYKANSVTYMKEGQNVAMAQPAATVPPVATVPPAATVEPTTPEPATLEPTTVDPATIEPTTPEPTTLEPTTPAAVVGGSEYSDNLMEQIQIETTYCKSSELKWICSFTYIHFNWFISSSVNSAVVTSSGVSASGSLEDLQATCAEDNLDLMIFDNQADFETASSSCKYLL